MMQEDYIRMIAKGTDERSEGVRLLDRRGLKDSGQARMTKKVWLDVGSGEGTFTLALREAVGENVEIYSVDKDKNSLEIQEKRFASQFPETELHLIHTDFSKPLDLPKFDGILAANSIHYIKDQVAVLRLLRSYLKDDARLIVVEYNVDEGNYWVPYAFSYQTFEKIAKEAGFAHVELLEKVPSEWLQEMYSAIARK